MPSTSRPRGALSRRTVLRAAGVIAPFALMNDPSLQLLDEPLGKLSRWASSTP
jgi:hypothetical protein